MYDAQEGASLRQLLEDAGFRRVERGSGKVYWEEPGGGRLLSEEAAVKRLREEGERRLREAGWEPSGAEEGYWLSPRSGRLYPWYAALGLLNAGESP
ncbi:hypothetical protein Rxyl_0916 [Rubrobacter xylanophilus DSM 9941]|uniref:Uncharacterized protein n=1 Tax=Rubrobacter xylanophilus (strain DSM 9941 / JCM 11954 / NBRC 16129 / PRD-1) TaxID=266117 RepID=Q1AXJ5_RUBXD|nr:hypothetical protein [Rubrobacter xylanophilus]ABG03883.1 hypothetical protein Rxyl_0916 [Rubrobacter xylanophilus DSM 9941]